jgi:hypothetical protein
MANLASSHDHTGKRTIVTTAASGMHRISRARATIEVRTK